MKTKVTVLPAVRAPMEFEVDLPAEPGYNALRMLVMLHFEKGTDMEHVRVFSEAGEYVSMFVDESGMLKGLPVNPLATVEYQRNVRVNAPDSELAKDMPLIYGPAVLFDRNVWF